jgi:hypothetical protein
LIENPHLEALDGVLVAFSRICVRRLVVRSGDI